MSFKDIYNLFADTGLGKNSISVISQNKVDEVLNTKPEERRYFLKNARELLNIVNENAKLCVN